MADTQSSSDYSLDADGSGATESFVPIMDPQFSSDIPQTSSGVSARDNIDEVLDTSSNAHIEGSSRTSSKLLSEKNSMETDEAIAPTSSGK